MDKPKRVPWTAEEIVRHLALCDPKISTLVVRARDWVERQGQARPTTAAISNPTREEPRRFDWGWLISELERLNYEIEQIKTERP